MFSYNPDYNTDNEISPTEYNPERDVEPIDVRDDMTSYISGDRAVGMLENGFTVHKIMLSSPDKSDVIITPEKYHILVQEDLDFGNDNFANTFDVDSHTFYASRSDVELQIEIETISLWVDDLTDAIDSYYRTSDNVALLNVPYDIETYARTACDILGISVNDFDWNNGQNVYQNISNVLLYDKNNHTDIRSFINCYINDVKDDMNYEDFCNRHIGDISRLESKLETFTDKYCPKLEYAKISIDLDSELLINFKDRLEEGKYEHFFIDDNSFIVPIDDMDYIEPILCNDYGTDFGYDKLSREAFDEIMFAKARDLICGEIVQQPNGYNIVLPDELLKSSKDLAFYVQSYKGILKEPDDYLPEIRRDTFENFSSDVYAFGNKDVQRCIEDAFKIAFYDALSDNDKSIVDYYLENNNLNLSLAFIEEGFKGVNFNIFNDEARKQFSNMIIDLRNPKSKKEIKERD